MISRPLSDRQNPFWNHVRSKLFRSTAPQRFSAIPPPNWLPVSKSVSMYVTLFITELPEILAQCTYYVFPLCLNPVRETIADRFDRILSTLERMLQSGISPHRSLQCRYRSHHSLSEIYRSQRSHRWILFIKTQSISLRNIPTFEETEKSQNDR